MEPCESNTIFAQLVDVGGADLSTKTSRIREAEVVCNYDEEIGLLGRSHD